ncbi:MAG: response regulator, partial [Bacteroidota bacterium]|nr:response regulator [Bacteroidota bacterium]
MNKKILIIDKEPETLGTLETILTKKGYKIRSTTDCNEATRIFKSESFDLVIADIRIPGQDGLAFIRQLKSLDEDTEIIVLTGSPTIQNIIQAMRSNGAFDLLTKPLENLDQLFISVDQALEKTRLNREKSAFIKKLRNYQPAGKKILIVDDDIDMQDLL